MSASNTPDVPETSTTQSEDEISLLDLLIVLAKYKKLILGLPFAAAVLTAGITLLMPNIYTATTRILPPQQQQSTAAAMLGQLGALAGAAGGSLGIKNPNDLYVGMLKSRTVADNLIGQFKLQALYKKKTMVETYRALDKVSSITAGKDGIISIEVDDENPKRAADMANAYVDELYKLTQNLAVTEASQRRLFFEKQLKKAKDELAGAEVAFKQTQEKTGVLQIDAQGKAMIEAVGAIRAQIAAKEVEMGALRTFATEQNPDYLRAQQELIGLRAQLGKYEKGGESDLLPTGKLPEAGLENIRKLRDVKYYETLYELLAKQYEMSRVDEARDASIIQVLDKAVSPDRKSKPKRAVTVILTAVVIGILAILIAFLRESLGKARQNPEQAMRLANLRDSLGWR
jgi:tyrosine-protein kinase Etk/Wzc